MVEIAKENATVEMMLTMLGERRKMWEDMFVRKCGFPVDGLVGLVKCIAAYLVYATAELDVENQSFKPVKPTPSTPSSEQLEMQKLLGGAE